MQDSLLLGNFSRHYLLCLQRRLYLQSLRLLHFLLCSLASGLHGSLRTCCSLTSLLVGVGLSDGELGVGKCYLLLRLVATDGSLLLSLSLFNLHVGVELGDATLLSRVSLLHINVLLCLGTSHLRLLVGIGESHLRDAFLVGLRHGYLLLLACGSDSHFLVFAGLGNACLALPYLVRNLYRTELLLLLNVSLSLVLRLRLRLLTEIDDVVGCIAYVADVDVHQIQTELAQFGVDVVLHLGEELVAVGVQLLDGHIGDDETHLSVNHVGDEVLLVVH